MAKNRKLTQLNIIKMLNDYIDILDDLEFFLFGEGLDNGNEGIKLIIQLQKRLNEIKANISNSIDGKQKKDKMPRKVIKKG
jgi:hypothetical protein